MGESKYKDKGDGGKRECCKTKENKRKNQHSFLCPKGQGQKGLVQMGTYPKGTGSNKN
jgi:hypothetical protein